MDILVTGGAGYLGSVLTRRLLEEGHRVTVYDNLKYNQLSLMDLAHHSNFNFVYGDVRDGMTNQIRKHIRDAEVIFPLAAIVGFPACEANKEEAIDVNYHAIVDTVDMMKGQKIIFPNSNSGYGSPTVGAVCTEDMELNPVSHYGKSKVAAEKALLYNGNAIVLRLATVFGVSPRMRLDLLVNEFVYKALTDKYITIFEKQFVRNYIHIQDVASAFIYMMDNYDKYKGEIFNVGLSESNLTKQELVETIKKYIPDFAITYSDYYEDPDKRNYLVSNDKIESTDWKPEYSIDDGIIELIKAYSILIKYDSSLFRNAFPISYGIPI